MYPQVNPAPSNKLRLEWVYGYRGRDARANLHLLPTGNKTDNFTELATFGIFEFLINKNDFFCIFYQVNDLFLHQSYLKAHYKKC